MITPTADVSVRSAWAQDSAAIADIQVRAWRQNFAAILPDDVLAALPEERFQQQWHSSIARPGDARQRVLVALERATVRGFAATAPGTDSDADPVTDAEVAEVVVDPAYVGLGHGSRLLHAAVDTMRSDRFERASMWLHVSDDRLREFLSKQGWEPDGAHRELDLHGDGAVLAKQVRVHTDLRSGD